MSNSSKVLQEFSDVRITGKVTQSSVVSATESLTAAATLDSSDSGKIFFLNLAGGFTTTLPAPEAGLALKFIVATAPTTSYIITAGSALIHGLAVASEDALGSSAGTSGTAVAAITLVAAKAQIGDCVDLVSDGTRWFASVAVVQQDAATFA
jgi:hypothetical protein